MQLNEEQKKIVETLQNKVIVDSSAASGKALENGSIVYTDNGPQKIEDSKIGDKIYGEDGKLHTITGVFPQGKKKKYRVIFNDDTEISCCEEHLWTFQTEQQRSAKSKTWNTYTLKEIIEKFPLFINSRAKNNFSNNPTKRKNIFIPMTKPIDFSKKELPLDPYTLGALLGDGALGRTGKATIFTNEDEDVIEKVKIGLKQIGCWLQYKDRFDYTVRQCDENFEVRTPEGGYNKGKLTKILENLGLDGKHSDNKFIPNIYKYSSIEDRLQLLMGIIDTDGYCNGSSYDLVLKSKQLILDVKELCESLGLTAVLYTKKAICTNSSVGAKDCGIVYRLYIKTNKLIPKIHSSIKREKQWKPTKVYSFRAIVDIIPTDEEVEMTCIKVDNPTSLFLTNNFIVTHNTRTLTERVKFLLDAGIKPNGIVVITFTNAAAEEMLDRLGEMREGVFIGTIHSYMNYLLLSKGIDTRHYLDEENYDMLYQLVNENQDCVQEVEFLLVDEAQDCDDEQWHFILDLVRPKNWMFFGDIKQNIYEWRGANLYMLSKLKEEDNVVSFKLRNNYRNDKKILQFAKQIISKNGILFRDDSVPKSKEEGQVILEDMSFDLFKDYIEQSLLDGYSYKDWFILTRTNIQLDNIYNFLKENEVPCSTFKRSELTNEELKKIMNEDTVKVLTIHTAKGLEAPCVIVIGARYYSDEERRVSYVAATRAKHILILARSTPQKKPKIQEYE